MTPQAFLSEHFAVIRRHDDATAVVPAATLEKVDELGTLQDTYAVQKSRKRVMRSKTAKTRNDERGSGHGGGWKWYRSARAAT